MGAITVIGTTGRLSRIVEHLCMETEPLQLHNMKIEQLDYQTTFG
jgi:hypothetical protein